MEVLEYLQTLRTPLGDKLNLMFSAIGQEAVVVMVMCVIFWCMDRKFGYRIGFSFFLSGVAVQTLKIIFKIPRPWILSKSITPVEGAKEAATGYSFPSAHTQGATSLYGAIAYNVRKKVVQFVMLIIILLIAFSRMYLGVHSPMDVSVALVLSFAITYAVNYAIDKKVVYKFSMEQILAVLLVIPVAMLVMCVIQVGMYHTAIEHILDLIKFAGAAVGFLFGWYLENKYLKFDASKGSVSEKVLRVAIGVVIILLIKTLLKPMEREFYVFGFVRYFIILFFGIFVYPYLFTKIPNRKKGLKK
ncbi:MAG: phosphatase PAP2 family protein [Lachnospiraceae bacterium]|nr:phosphatase PAP2 family protein [Lachnospiraceae bacterium]